MKNLRIYIFCFICTLCNSVLAQAYFASSNASGGGKMPDEEELKAEGSPLELKDGKYVFTSNVTLDMSTSPRHNSAIRVKEGSKAVLRIPKGVKVTLKGSHALNGQAYPAIELPSSSTLILTGEGELVADGGDGQQATDGENGKKGNIEFTGDWPMYPGDGGKGGTGGTGSAPGIGTRSGKGGNGGTTISCSPVIDVFNTHKPEFTAHKGNDGESTADMGTLIVLGTVKVTSNRGNIKGTFYVNNAQAGGCFDYWPSGAYYCRSAGGGGGGGQGGSAYTANYGIGAGAPGSGGGGGGGCGATDKAWYHRNLKFDFGYGGKGGAGLTTGGDGQKGYHSGAGCNDRGADGGSGGKVGKRGGNGFLYFSSLTDIRSDKGTAYEESSVRRLGELTNKQALNYLPRPAINKMTGARWSNDDEVMDFYCGMQLKDGMEKVVIPEAPRATCHFKGYFDQYGNQVYNAEGKLDIRKTADDSFYYVKDRYDKWYVLSLADIKLHAQWSDSVYVTVLHCVENANLGLEGEESKYTDHKPEYIEVKGYELPQGATSMQLKLRKFYDLNGKAITQLLTEEEKGMSAANRRYRVAEGEEETTTVTLGDEAMKVIVQKYDRNSFPLRWDYSTVLTKERFDSLLINKESYTADGNYKYGKNISRPLMEAYHGRVIKDWTPEEVYAVPAHECVMTPVVADTTYLVTLNIDKADTDCDLNLSKLSGIRYGEEVTVKANLVDDTRLSLLNIYSRRDSAEVAYTQKDDTTYTFLMPDGGAVVDAAFAFAHYGVNTIVADRKKVKMAIEGHNGLIYTDDNDWFQFPDSVCGGSLSAFEVYRNQIVNVYVEVVEDSITDAHEGALRPTVTLHCGRKEYDEVARVCQTVIGGRVLRYSSFTLDDARDVTLKVFLTNHLKKRINFIGTFSTSVSSAFSDMEADIMEQTAGASACVDDMVYFTVKTEDKNFNHDNVVVSYIDAYNRQRFVPVNDISSGDSLVFSFLMPNRNVDVNLYTGTKVALKDNFDTAYNNIETPSSSLPDRDPDYHFIMPDSAVAGSVVPFFIFENLNRGYNRDIHPIITYASSNKAASVFGFEYYDYQTAVANYEVGSGWFVMPEGVKEVSMDNGFMYPAVSEWFTTVEAQTLTLTSLVEAYTVTLQEDHTYALHRVKDDDVAPFTPLLCHIDVQKVQEFANEVRESVFVGSNPFSMADAVLVNDLRYVEEDMTCSELRQKLMAETGCDYLIYTFSADRTPMEANAKMLVQACADEGYGTFYALADDALLSKNDVYLPVANTGSADPIPVTGVENILTEHAEGHGYNLMGVRVGLGYKGIVVKGGKKYLKTK